MEEIVKKLVILATAAFPRAPRELRHGGQRDHERAGQYPGQSRRIASHRSAFNVQQFLSSGGVARKVVEYRGSETIYAQGDGTDKVFYIQAGGVRLSVVNHVGKEAVLAMLGPGDFFGEGGLAGQSVRMSTATAIDGTTLLAIEKAEMARVLHEEHDFSDRFVGHMLTRNIKVEEDLIDQLFNSSEKRLARTLLLLARHGTQEPSEKILPKISQEMLGEMIGTTRSRVNVFMNKFRKLGFIEYNGECNGGLHVNRSLLSVVLQE
jgi:CRP/FNR family cyclic AMP-dependent transcriptional regulator